MIRFTARVRRGLADLRQIALDAVDDSKPPASHAMLKWPKWRRDEYELALAWIEQEISAAPASGSDGGGN